MNHLSTFCSFALIAAAIQPLSAEDADSLQVAAAKAFTERQDSTVNLSVTRKIKGKDQTFEVPAVSFDGKGLLVAALKASEGGPNKGPANFQIGGDDGDEDESDGDAGGAKPKAKNSGELTKVALLRSDATESEADLVLTDATLGLAFVRVRAAGADVAMPPAPPLAKGAPVLLEDLLAVERLGSEFQRAATASQLQIAAVLTTPRRLYVPSVGVAGGVAVYTLHGELLGISSTVHDESVIIPAEAIQKLAASLQAKADKQP